MSPLRILLAVVATLGAVVAGGLLECGPFVPAEVSHGAELYGRMCAVCHGPGGEGYVADRAPALGHPAFLESVTDDFLRAAIVHGRRGTTMSPWSVSRGGPLADEDVAALIAFVRTWQKSPALGLDLSHKSPGDAERGKKAYEAACQSCHGARGQGGEFIAVGNVQLLSTAGNGFLRHAIEHGREGTKMAAFGAQIGEASVDDLVAALRSFAQPERPEPRPASTRPPPLPLGPVPMNPNGPEPVGFLNHPERTAADVIKAAWDKKAKMAFLDAREPSAFSVEHIEGAVSVPFYDPKPYFDKLPKDAWLISYCACPHAESRILAAALAEAGFKKVTILDEGMRVWKARGYPMTGKGDL